MDEEKIAELSKCITEKFYNAKYSLLENGFTITLSPNRRISVALHDPPKKSHIQIIQDFGKNTSMQSVDFSLEGSVDLCWSILQNITRAQGEHPFDISGSHALDWDIFQ
jgi:hypothetical protein